MIPHAHEDVPCREGTKSLSGACTVGRRLAGGSRAAEVRQERRAMVDAEARETSTCKEKRSHSVVAHVIDISTLVWYVQRSFADCRYLSFRV